MKRSFTIIFLLIGALCSAQVKMNIYFLKNDGRYVPTRDSADYIRAVTEPDSGSTLYNVTEFYLNNKRKSIGKSSKIDPPRYEGQCISYFDSGTRQVVSSYQDGKKINDEFQFYPNGKPYLVLKYLPSKTEDHNPDGDYVEDYLITANYDSTGAALVSEGNGTFKIFDARFKRVVETGTVKNGTRDGECRGSDHDGKWNYTEKYDNGLLISGSLTDETGAVSTYTKARGTEPQYKGGLTAFYNYLGHRIRYPDYEKDHNITGVVVLTFIVAKDGRLTNVKILSSVSPGIDNEAVRVVGNSPLWIPGTWYGRPVKVIYRLPVSFALSQ